MLLISESEYEDQLLLAVSTLLRDLGVNVQPFERKESIAAVFWEISDFYETNPWYQTLSDEEKMQFLYFIELEIRSAVILAGFQAIEQGIENYRTLYA